MQAGGKDTAGWGAGAGGREGNDKWAELSLALLTSLSSRAPHAPTKQEAGAPQPGANSQGPGQHEGQLRPADGPQVPHLHQPGASRLVPSKVCQEPAPARACTLKENFPAGSHTCAGCAGGPRQVQQYPLSLHTLLLAA